MACLRLNRNIVELLNMQTFRIMSNGVSQRVVICLIWLWWINYITQSTNPETREPSLWASASVAHCPQVALDEISEAILWQGAPVQRRQCLWALWCQWCAEKLHRASFPAPHSATSFWGRAVGHDSRRHLHHKSQQNYTYWTPLQPYRNLAVKHWPTHPCATFLAARKWCPVWEGEPEGFSLHLLHRSYGTPSPKLSFQRTHQLETVSFRADLSQPLSKCVVLRCIEVIADNILVKTTMVLNIREQ